MKVLLATDGSIFAEEAAWLLSHLPHVEPLELIVLSVQVPMEIHASPEVASWIQQNAQQEKERSATYFQRIAAMFEGADAKLEFVTAQGHAGKTIISQAQDRGVDLIVIGARGHSILERVMLGSTSDFVATHANCSVLVVRPTGLREQTHRELRICLGHDGSEPCEYAVSQLGQFEWRQNTQLDVLSVLTYPSTYMNEPVQFDTGPLCEAMQKSVNRTAESLCSLVPNATAHLIEASNVGDGIVRFTEEHESDMVVLGKTGFGLIASFLLGSVSKFVLRHASCSVWIARESK